MNARWITSLALGVVAVAATQLWLPHAGLAWLAVQAAGIAVSAVALLRAPLATRTGWWLVVAARAAGLIATAAFVAHMAGGHGAPRPTDLALATAAQYALYAAAVGRLTRRHRAGATRFEAGAIVVGAAMLLWALVIEPYLGKPGYREVTTGVVLIYALLDTAVMAAVLRGVFTAPRGPARLLSAAGTALLTGHLLYAAMSSAGSMPFLPGGISFFFVQLWGVILTAAALHPEAPRLGAAQDGGERLLTRAKLTGILLTTVLSPYVPIFTAVRSGRPVTADMVVPATLVASLCGLLLGRIFLMARTDRRQAATLRYALQEQELLQQQLTYRAGHDSLTGLANRDLFAERLADADPKDTVVLLCGIDGFKAVNDAYGHSAGDEVLRILAARLLAETGTDGLVARLGGDEFGILLGGDPAPAQELVTRITHAIAEPIDADGLRLYLTVSAGLACGTTPDEDGPAAGSTLGDADLALQAAKRGGRDRVVWYDAQLRSEQIERTQIADGLRRALNEGALHLQYQPIVNAATGAVVGVEALMRWGRVSPSRFIPVAEQTGLIGAIGEFALRTACREARRWYREHGVYVTVNVSSHQLRDPGFADSVLVALRDTGLPAAALVLEITESVLIDAEDAEEHLRMLRYHGVRIAIDDFGTGYSSLAYLHQLPVDILKIDRTFVSRDQKPGDVAFTRAILDLARSQGLVAVAEGVETAAQANLLRELECPLIQGFFFSRPVDPDVIDTRLTQEALAA